jgi:hypothetical protein
MLRLADGEGSRQEKKNFNEAEAPSCGWEGLHDQSHKGLLSMHSVLGLVEDDTVS